MTRSELRTLEQVWSTIAPLVFVPHTAQEYDRLIQMLDTLIDLVGEDETHPLASLMDIISVLVERYEDEQVPALN